MNQVATEAPHDGPEIEGPFERVIAAVERHGVKVRRQRATFRDLVRRSDEEILAVAVQARQRADHIPNVGANPEFRHATDVDGYFHNLNLTTGGREGTGNSPDLCCSTLAGRDKKAAPLGAALFKEAKWREAEEN